MTYKYADKGSRKSLTRKLHKLALPILNHIIAELLRQFSLK